MVSNNKFYIILFFIIVCVIIALKCFPHGKIIEGLESPKTLIGNASDEGANVTLALIQLGKDFMKELTTFPTLESSNGDYFTLWQNSYHKQTQIFAAIITGLGAFLLSTLGPVLFTMVIFFGVLFTILLILRWALKKADIQL